MTAVSGRLVRRAAGLAILLARTAAFSGCSLLVGPPPDTVVRAVNRAVDSIRATDGVAEVTVQISVREHAVFLQCRTSGPPASR